MFTLTELTVSDMVVASAELRQAATDATTMEDASNAVTTYLRHAFRTPDGTPAFTLIRLFQTVTWEELTPQLRSYAQARMPDGQPPNGTRCLTLFATHGDHPTWRDRRASRNHQAIPLTSPEILRRAPLALTAMDRLLAHRRQPGLDDTLVPTLTDPDNQPNDADIFHVADAVESPYLPGQHFIRSHGVASALALAGTLPAGHTFTVVVYSRVRVSAAVAELFRTLAASIRLALLPHSDGPLFRPPPAQTREPEPHHPNQHLPLAAQQTPLAAYDSADTEPYFPHPTSSADADLRDKQRRLEQETRIVETLYSVGQALARELDLRRLVQLATEAATSVVNAQIGVFFYTLSGTDGQPQTRFALAGVSREVFEAFPIPRRTELFGPQPPSPAVLRHHDITTHPRYRAGSPFQALPAGHPPVRAYLAVPVRTAAGETIGVFYFGHRNPGVFTERDEELAKGIAAQAAAAIDNARLYRRARDTAIELQRSLLPSSPPEIPELDIAFKYLPGAQGTQVGGDWFDVIRLAAGRVALVIGDVMGRGIRAAAVMGQLRTAVRAYAVMDLSPAQVMHQLNRLVCGMESELDAQIATCVYAVYDPGDSTISWSSAGHLPPALIDTDGTVTMLEADLGMPLGLDDAVFGEEHRTLPPRSSFLLYTDGLVECHDVPLTDRLGQLRTELAALGEPASTTATPAAEQVSDMCERIINAMLRGDEHDDVALLMVRARPVTIHSNAVELAPASESPHRARDFVRGTLDEWQLGELADTIVSVASEMVTNACEHANTTLTLRLRRHPGRIIVEVADHDGRIPRPAVTQLLDERHRGLLIVASLSRRWGVRPTETGKVVWAEIEDGSDRPTPADTPRKKPATVSASAPILVSLPQTVIPRAR